MNLLTFEEDVRSVIVKRGMTYYLDGRVVEVMKIQGEPICRGNRGE